MKFFNIKKKNILTIKGLRDVINIVNKQNPRYKVKKKLSNLK